MRSGWGERWSLAREERALVDRLLAGDEEAFERFVADYVPALYRFAGRRVGDRETARDVVQATLCKAIARLAGFRGEAGLATWLCACCRNEIADLYRRRGRAGTEVELCDEAMEQRRADAPSGPPDGPEQELLRRETGGLVHAVLDQLPPRYGRALEWKYLERLSVEEIGERLAIGAKAAESLLSRARVAFREAYLRSTAAGAPPGAPFGRVRSAAT